MDNLSGNSGRGSRCLFDTEDDFLALRFFLPSWLSDAFAPPIAKYYRGLFLLDRQRRPVAALQNDRLPVLSLDPRAVPPGWVPGCWPQPTTSPGLGSSVDEQAAFATRSHTVTPCRRVRHPRPALSWNLLQNGSFLMSSVRPGQAGKQGVISRIRPTVASGGGSELAAAAADQRPPHLPAQLDARWAEA